MKSIGERILKQTYELRDIQSMPTKKGFESRFISNVCFEASGTVKTKTKLQNIGLPMQQFVLVTGHTLAGTYDLRASV